MLLHLLLSGIAALVLLCLLSWRASIGRVRKAVDLLTPEYVSRSLSERFPDLDCRIREVSVVSVARCGDGKASTTDRIVVGVQWQDETQQARASCPAEMIFKCTLLPGFLRMGAKPWLIQTTGRLATFLSHLHLDFVRARIFFSIQTSRSMPTANVGLASIRRNRTPPSWMAFPCYLQNKEKGSTLGPILLP